MEDNKNPSMFDAYKGDIGKDFISLSFGKIKDDTDKESELTDDDIGETIKIEFSPDLLKDLISFLIRLGVYYQEEYGVNIGFNIDKVISDNDKI